MIDGNKDLITMNEGTLGEGGKRLGHFKSKMDLVFIGYDISFSFR